MASKRSDCPTPKHTPSVQERRPRTRSHRRRIEQPQRPIVDFRSSRLQWDEIGLRVCRACLYPWRPLLSQLPRLRHQDFPRLRDDKKSVSSDVPCRRPPTSLNETPGSTIRSEWPAPSTKRTAGNERFVARTSKRTHRRFRIRYQFEPCNRHTNCQIDRPDSREVPPRGSPRDRHFPACHRQRTRRQTRLRSPGEATMQIDCPRKPRPVRIGDGIANLETFRRRSPRTWP